MKSRHRCPDCGAEHTRKPRPRGVLKPGALGFDTNSNGGVSVMIAAAAANGWNTLVVPKDVLPHDPTAPLAP